MMMMDTVDGEGDPLRQDFFPFLKFLSFFSFYFAFSALSTRVRYNACTVPVSV